MPVAAAAAFAAAAFAARLLVAEAEEEEGEVPVRPIAGDQFAAVIFALISAASFRQSLHLCFGFPQ